MEFQQTADKAAGNQHLQFTAEIWKNDMNLPLSAKEDKVQVLKKNEFPFLDMKMCWSLEGDIKFSIFRKNGHQLKYVGIGSTQTPGTIRAVPSGVLNRLAKPTFRKNPLFILNEYTKSTPTMQTTSARRDLHLLFYQQWQNYGKIMMRIWIFRTKKNLTSTKRKIEISTFVLHAIFLPLSTG